MNQLDFSANIERFTGFAALYDGFRPVSPEAIGDLLCQIAAVSLPSCVVDLGCGTGLSTRYWVNRAQNIIGVEPSLSMRHQAEALGGHNISYREGFSHATGLPDACAQIVTCAQSLHWMDPFPTFQEAARILAPGGVFAAYDYDWPPITQSWEADAVYVECMKATRQLETEHGVTTNLQQWEKEGHLQRMQDSGAFRFVREIMLHHTEQGDAKRFVGIFLSQGSVRALQKKGVPEIEVEIERLQEIADRKLGPEPHRWFWTSRVRLGVV